MDGLVYTIRQHIYKFHWTMLQNISAVVYYTQVCKCANKKLAVLPLSSQVKQPVSGVF